MPAALTDLMPGDGTVLLSDRRHRRRTVLIVGPAGSGKAALLGLLGHELGEWRLAASGDDEPWTTPSVVGDLPGVATVAEEAS